MNWRQEHSLRYGLWTFVVERNILISAFFDFGQLFFTKMHPNTLCEYNIGVSFK